jgi:hypothetical protein
VFALAIGQPAPPTAFVVLDDDLGVFGAGDLAQTEPKEHPLAVFLVLVEIAEVDVAV